ncbi:YbfB/YjiJ family MFS transporter [Streptomyces sp. NPDC002265]|uniref:YbfB/YjiJ family MFS transporter n=1 Tax=Streptomyces sp. NPDC002265 TaxID=3154415 RepID=UPI00331F3659
MLARVRNTWATALGYIIGAGSAAWWSRRLGAGRSFVLGMIISALALLGSGPSSDFTALSVLRFVGGLATAVTFVVGSALASRVHTGGRQQRSAALVGVYMAGVGIGVVVSGIVVPSALTAWGASGWHAGWLLMGLLALLAAGPAAWAAKAVPPAPPVSGTQRRSGLSAMAPSFIWYVLFGAGYVSYMTFVIALLHDQGMSTWSTAGFFIVLGAASALATLLVWGRIVGRLRGGMALVSAVVLVGVLPVLLFDGLTAAMVCAVVFGAGFMAGPTSITVLARRMLPQHAWTSAIAWLTVAFSVGQAVGPLISGILSDSEGGIAKGLWLSVIPPGRVGRRRVGPARTPGRPTAGACRRTGRSQAVVPARSLEAAMPGRTVTVRESGPYAATIGVGPHRLSADEPEPIGTDAGPTPVELLLGALGACTSMTVRMYAKRKGWDLTHVDVRLRTDSHDGPRKRIVKDVEISGGLDGEQISGLATIAEHCPVQRMLGDSVYVDTRTVARPGPTAAAAAAA